LDADVVTMLFPTWKPSTIQLPAPAFGPAARVMVLAPELKVSVGW
jgi:hypothetical protein